MRQPLFLSSNVLNTPLAGESTSFCNVCDYTGNVLLLKLSNHVVRAASSSVRSAVLVISTVSPPAAPPLQAEETSPVASWFSLLCLCRHPPAILHRVVSFQRDSYREKWTSRRENWRPLSRKLQMWWIGMSNGCTDFLFDDTVAFGSDVRSSSSVRSMDVTSSKTTPLGWDFDGPLTGFVWAEKKAQTWNQWM